VIDVARLFTLFVLLATVSCSSVDPLSTQSASSETPTTEADTNALLGRLDGLRSSGGIDAEIADIRSKLAQPAITRFEYLLLQRRVEALEGRFENWAQVNLRVQRSVYAVLHAVPIVDDFELTFIGTAFSVNNTSLVTNAHIVDALYELDRGMTGFNRRYGTDLEGYWLVVQNLTTSLRYEANTFFLNKRASRSHRSWTRRDVFSPDVGLLEISAGQLTFALDLGSSTDGLRLRVGQPLATLGFPGELQAAANLKNLTPIATFKNGTLSALRPRNEGTRYTSRDTYIVQHNLNLSGGTSGSPIVDVTGTVVAVNNAGIDKLVFTLGGEPTRISQAALGFGIRVDKVRELLEQSGTVVAKRLPTSSPPIGVIEKLEGTKWPSLPVSSVKDPLENRLKRLLFP
jgi:V8-like Glu-specific endopeptidase